MKKNFLHALLLLTLCGPTLTTHAQNRLPIREYTNPDERLSMASDTKFVHAIEIFADMFKRYGGKILVYEGRDEKPININIPMMYWRDAFDMVLRVNNYWYDERENYIRIIQMGGTAVVAADSLQFSIEAIKNSRDVEISTIYFEASVTDLKALGIDWTVLNTAPSTGVGGPTTIDIQTNATDGITTKIGSFYKAANITSAINAITSSNIGEIISSPSIIVRSKEKGRIQVGSDISIKQKDFAGNIVENFFSTGLIAEVTPTVILVDSVNIIRLDIVAERSSVAPDPTRTMIDRTKATSSIYLLDNEETVIGGLYTNDNRVVRRGIPFLKDLPWWVFGLRYLTGYDETSLTKKELIIIIKARILPSLEDRIAQKMNLRDSKQIQDKLHRNDELYERIRAQVEAAKK